jgi:hypothetical protein
MFVEHTHSKVPDFAVHGSEFEDFLPERQSAALAAKSLKLSIDYIDKSVNRR